MMPFDPAARSTLKTGARPGLVRQPAPPLPGSPTAVRTGGPSAIHAAGAKPANAITASRHERVFKRGSLMFIEGESGEEMFILKTGKVKVLKQEGGKTIQLALLGPGSVLGEMSLLIDMPRSATAQVVEDTTAIAINRNILEDTYSKIPPWFVSVIKVLVGRLHDTLRRNSDNLVRDHIGGVTHVLLLLMSEATKTPAGLVSVNLNKLKEEALNTIGISGADTDRIVTELILKELVVIRKGERNAEFVDVLKPDILQLYFEYKFGKSNGKPIAGDSMTDGAFKLIKLLLAAGREKGVRQKDGSINIAKSVFELESDRAGQGRFIDMDAVDELAALKLITLIDTAKTTQHLVSKQFTFSFQERKIEKALLVREWIGAFSDAN
ncbi:MAG: Crp/Fnr family transcriptional regulator [Fibrobacteres bacterium]|nr:Crp/Fnr family transcriptional regulator [Fibrobacterota bacterium]